LRAIDQLQTSVYEILFTKPFEQSEHTNFNHLNVLNRGGSVAGSRVVSVLDSGADGHGFKSQSRRGRVTVLGKLFTPIVPLFTKKQKLAAALLRVAGVTVGLAEIVAAYRRVYDSRHLQADCQEPKSAPEPYAR